MSTATYSSDASATNTKQNRSEFWQLALRFRWQLGLTYGLFVLENSLLLLQPLLLGWAINDLLAGSYAGLAWFALGHTAHMALRLGRRMYDTRAFAGIYQQRASQLVLDQRSRGVKTSKVAARTSLAREFVEFFERQVPMVIRSAFSLVGAVLILFVYDAWLVAYCAALLLPALVLNFVFGRRSLRLASRLHDELEREVDVVGETDQTAVADHYQNTMRWRIKLSDCEAWTASLLEIFVLALFAGALIRFCSLPGATAGDIFAVFRYVLLFVMALDRMPMMIQQAVRLTDIGKRMRPGHGS